MDDALFMRFFQRFGNLQSDRRCIPYRKRAGLKLLRERFPLYAFHDDVVDAILLSSVIHCCDVRVVQFCQRERFGAEAAARLISRKHARGQDFDRHIAIELFISRTIHKAHAAGAERFDDGVAPETGSRIHCLNGRGSPSKRSEVQIGSCRSSVGRAVASLLFGKQAFDRDPKVRQTAAGIGQIIGALFERQSDNHCENFLCRSFVVRHDLHPPGSGLQLSERSSRAYAPGNRVATTSIVEIDAGAITNSR